MTDLSRFHNHMKSESDTDSEEDLLRNKKTKVNESEDNQLAEPLFACNQFKASKHLDIEDKPHSNASKRFTVWSEVLMEEELNDNLNNCINIKSNTKRSLKIDRNHENYSFWLKKQLNDKESEDLTQTESNSNEKRSKKRKKKSKKNKKEFRDIGLEIAAKLSEPKHQLIRRVVDAIGEEKALELCSSTLSIESVGGLMTADNSRRRSAGGVFFQLLKNDTKITKESIDYIFHEEQQVFKQKKKIYKRAKRRHLNNSNNPNNSIKTNKKATTDG